MWTVRPTEEYGRRRRKYEKKRWRELEAAEQNAETYRVALVCGTKPLQIKYGFVHPEGNGVVAVDQSGHGGNLAETRLYLYPDTDAEVLYFLTIGDKNSQDGDIQFSKEVVEALIALKGRITDHDESQGQEGTGIDE